jgi:hypothetical protein
VRLERQLVSLLVLLADREEPDDGVVHSQDLVREDGSHVSELEKVLRPRVGVRARVDQEGGTFPAGNDDADPGAMDARQATDV